MIPTLAPLLTEEMRAALCTVLRRVVTLAIAVGLVLFMLFYFVAFESRFFPPLYAWTPTSARAEGSDLIVTGHMRRRRDACEYLPPHSAYDADGDSHRVVSSSPTASESWQASDTPRVFGPWRVVGGAGEVLRFSSLHRCHPFGVTRSALGEIDARAIK